MTDFICILSCIMVGFIIGTISGCNGTKDIYNKKLKSVGIEKIMECNNTQSNWYEIVWIKK